MTPRLRRILWIAGSLIAALIVLALVIPLFIDINKYHDTIEAKAEGLLRRDVTLGTMKLTLFPITGVRVQPLAHAAARERPPPRRGNNPRPNREAGSVWRSCASKAPGSAWWTRWCFPARP